jgi:hypothetical protein
MLVGMKAGRCSKAPPYSVIQLVGTEYHNAATSCRLDTDPVSCILLVSTVGSGVL